MKNIVFLRFLRQKLSKSIVFFYFCKFGCLKWQPNPSKTSAWALGMRRFTIRADTFFRQTSAANCMQKLGQRFSRVRPFPGKLKNVVFLFSLCVNHSKHEAKHSFF